MKKGRCPYHVKQGIAVAPGKFVLSDVCGIKSACGANCPFAPFDEQSFTSCASYVALTRGLDKQVLMPREEIDFFTDRYSRADFTKIDF